MNDDEMLTMLIEYMEKGFLENIIALFKQEPEFAKFIPDMLRQENVGVRLGTTALVEELAGAYDQILLRAVPGLIGLLEHENPTVRGDAAYVLGVMRAPAAREPLALLKDDDNRAVREIAADALKEWNER
jgi:HEAT repeat protein